MAEPMTHIRLQELENIGENGHRYTKQVLRSAIAELAAEVRRGWRAQEDGTQGPEEASAAAVDGTDPADVMRRAADRLRVEAAAVRAYIETGRFYLGATDDVDDRYRLGIQGAIPGPGGKFASCLTPALADLLADSWDAEAADMADYPAILVANGVGIALYPDEPNPVWTTAYRAAQAYLAAAGPSGGDGA